MSIKQVLFSNQNADKVSSFVMERYDMDRSKKQFIDKMVKAEMTVSYKKINPNWKILVPINLC